MNTFVTIDDESGDFICADDVVACQAQPEGANCKSVIFTGCCGPIGTQLTAKEFRARCDIAVGRANN